MSKNYNKISQKDFMKTKVINRDKILTKLDSLFKKSMVHKSSSSSYLFPNMLSNGKNNKLKFIGKENSINKMLGMSYSKDESKFKMTEQELNNMTENSKISNEENMITSERKETKKKLMSPSRSESSINPSDEYKIPRIKKDYYSSFLIIDSILKKREKLIQGSVHFYKNQKKLNFNFKKKKEDLSEPKKKDFAKFKKIPSIFAFGQKLEKKSKSDIFANNKEKKVVGINQHSLNIFRSGLINDYSIKKMKQLKLIKDTYSSNIPGTEFYLPKDAFGNIIYPVLSQRKMLKNVLPKEFDYNIVRSPIELLHETYHPLLRFQKKMLGQHINCINQEIDITYSKPFTLVDKNKIPEKFKISQDLIELQKDEKLVRLLNKIIEQNSKNDKDDSKNKNNNGKKG